MEGLAKIASGPKKFEYKKVEPQQFQAIKGTGLDELLETNRKRIESFEKEMKKIERQKRVGIGLINAGAVVGAAGLATLANKKQKEKEKREGLAKKER